MVAVSEGEGEGAGASGGGSDGAGLSGDGGLDDGTFTCRWYAGVMEVLNEEQIAAELAAVPEWKREGNAIVCRVKRADFRAAMLYVGAVAYLAEEAGHHPDIAISWNQVTLTLWTHSAGGLTPADFALARRISTLG